MKMLRNRVVAPAAFLRGGSTNKSPLISKKGDGSLSKNLSHLTLKNTKDKYLAWLRAL